MPLYSVLAADREFEHASAHNLDPVLYLYHDIFSALFINYMTYPMSCLYSMRSAISIIALRHPRLLCNRSL